MKSRPFRLSTVSLILLGVMALWLSGCASAPTKAEGAKDRAAASAQADQGGDESGGSALFDDDPFADEDESAINAPDPIEPLNRGVFWLNDKLYFYVLKPVSKAYRFAVHEKIRTGVSNFFSNLTAPVSVANSLLQLDFEGAYKETSRFFINTMLGVFGVMDIAGEYGGLEKNQEDLGQTLGSYGLGHGFYLVLPVLGPSSLRDGMGTAGDYAFSPYTYSDLTLEETAGLKTLEVVNMLSLDKDTYEAVVRQSPDPYLTVRDIYLQRRRAQVEK